MSEIEKPTSDFASVLAKWPILGYASFSHSHTHFEGTGRYRTGACPWHPDRCMILDTEQNTYSVVGEEPGGDVIDWHTKYLNVDRTLAAAHLAQYSIAFIKVLP
jgi:hypothetical protein